VNGAISSFDAARIALHVAGPPNPQLNATQLLVADVSGNNSVTSFDAGMIAKFVAGPPYGAPGIGATATWKFSPATRNFGSIASNITGQDFDALLMGDVSGNWANTGARTAGTAGSRQMSDVSADGRAELKPITVSAESVVMAVEKEIVVPVTVRGMAGKGVISYEFDLRYDPFAIKPLENPAGVAGTVSRGLSVVTNAIEPGSLRVVVYGAMPIDDDGVLLNLRFMAVGAAGTISPLVWERIMFNDGEPGVTVTDGKVELY
jgi:hypothetical protein